MIGRNLDPGPLLYQPEDVAQTMLDLVHKPRDEVAVGWPARAGQIAYAAAPGLTERAIGGAIRYLLSRARPAEISAGTMLTPAPIGADSSGGWLQRKNLPPAREITRLAGYTSIVVVALVIAGRIGRRRRRA